jgi:hypothetical protein
MHGIALSIAAPETSKFVSAPDGLMLHVREYGPRNTPLLPVVCLPGLSRTAGDFEVLAGALSSDTNAPHRLLALDYRGRGLSECDRDPANYTVSVELADLLAVLTARDVGPAVFIRTSARRDPCHAARWGAPDGHCGCSPQRHRASGRDQGIDADQGICWQNAPAANV